MFKYVLSVNSQTPRINATESQDSQSERIKTAMRSKVDIKTPHKLNSKGEGLRWASDTADPGDRLKGL